MEKTCFIIMPISDIESYPIGHFKRVYEYIIKPAVEKTGFIPIRADDILNTNYIAIDVIKRIITSEMALCDLSARNSNVFYELGIRQAFNLPVTLIRDSITERAFDIQGFRDIEYDHSLRVDSIESTKTIISETLLNTYNSSGREINSLISLLGVHTAKASSNIEISKEAEIILNSLDNLGSRLSKIETLLPNASLTKPVFHIDDSKGIWQEVSVINVNELKVGDVVNHQKYGQGKIISREGTTVNPIVSVLFEYNGEKKLMINYAKLSKFIPKP